MHASSIHNATNKEALRSWTSQILYLTKSEEGERVKWTMIHMTG